MSAPTVFALGVTLERAGSHQYRTTDGHHRVGRIHGRWYVVCLCGGGCPTAGDGWAWQPLATLGDAREMLARHYATRWPA